MNKLLILLLIGLLTVSIFAEGDSQPTANTTEETAKTQEEGKDTQPVHQEENKQHSDQQGQNQQEQKQDDQNQQKQQDQQNQQQQDQPKQDQPKKDQPKKDQPKQEKQDNKQNQNQEKQKQQQQQKEKEKEKKDQKKQPQQQQQQKQQNPQQEQKQQQQNFEQQIPNQQPQQEQEVNNNEPRKEEQTEVVDDEDRGAIMADWEKHMQDFVPDEMLTFEVNAKSEELFMEDIDKPTLIRGAYFVSYFSDEKIDFTIRDPTKKRIFHKINKREGIFSLNVTDKGQYEFLFSNIKGKDKKSITFALDIHNVTETHLSHHDLDPVEKKLDHVSSGIKDYLSEQRFASKRQISQLESIQSAHKRLLVFSIVEVLIVVVATAWQVYYIKKILDNKRIV